MQRYALVVLAALLAATGVRAFSPGSRGASAPQTTTGWVFDPTFLPAAPSSPVSSTWDLGDFSRPGGSSSGSIPSRFDAGGTEGLVGGAGGMTPSGTGLRPHGAFGSGNAAGWGTRTMVLPHLLETSGRTSGAASGTGLDLGIFTQYGAGGGPTSTTSSTPVALFDPVTGEPITAPAAGPASESPVGYDQRTRWETVKEWLRRFMEAYVQGDLGGALRAFSRNMLQDSSLLRLALQEDFRNQTNINIDIELLEYRMSFDTVIVRIRWNRTAVDQQSGQATVQTGVSRLLFDRHDGFRLAGWFGSSPFGLFTALWQQQVEAGDPNGSGPTGSNIRSATGLSLNILPSIGATDHLSLEVDAGASPQLYDGDAVGVPPPVPAGHDFIAFVVGCGAGSCTVQVSSDGFNNISPGYPSQGVVACAPGQPLEDFGAIQNSFSDFATLVFPDTGGPYTRTIAVQTEMGNYGLVEFRLTPGAPYPALLDMRWINIGTNLGATGLPGAATCM